MSGDESARALKRLTAMPPVESLTGLIAAANNASTAESDRGDALGCGTGDVAAARVGKEAGPESVPMLTCFAREFELRMPIAFLSTGRIC